MSTITTRAGKGSPLTNNEVDANFTNLNNDKLEVVSETDVTQHQAALSITELQISDLDKYTTSEVDALISSIDTYDQSLNTTDSVSFASVQLTGGDGTQGTLSWNIDEETLDLIQNGATLQVGQETQIHVTLHGSAASIADGEVVVAVGTNGGSGKILVCKASLSEFNTCTGQSVTEIPAKYVIGVATEAITNNGKVTNFGKINDVVGASYTQGAVYYVDESNGGLTATEPTTGLVMPIAFAINSDTLMVRTTAINELLIEHGETAYGWGDHSSQGYITGLSVSGLNDATITTVADNDLLAYDNASGDWINQSAAEAGLATTSDVANSTNWDTAYSWGDHSAAGYLTSETSHADVVVDGDFISEGLIKRGATSGSYSIVTDNSANWNTAYGWGDHSAAGYLTSYTETDPIYTASSWFTTTNNSSNWDAAYSWGDHSAAGYLTSETSHADVVVDGDFVSEGLIKRGATSGTYSIVTDNSVNWDTAYGWGDHSSAGYITGYTVTEADVTTHEAAITITESQISDFGTYEPADATILKDADIGVTVQAYDANIMTTDSAQVMTAELTVKEFKETISNLSGSVIDPANGTIQYKVLTGNTSFSENLTDGQAVTLRLEGGATYTVTWPTMTWIGSGGNVAPTLNGTKDVVVIWQESSIVYGAYVGYGA